MFDDSWRFGLPERISVSLVLLWNTTLSLLVAVYLINQENGVPPGEGWIFDFAYYTLLTIIVVGVWSRPALAGLHWSYRKAKAVVT